MNLSRLSSLRSLQERAGFTMIELLIVITILGILATAVLSAINPIEQINRGRDTGSRSDAEQLLSAIERYNAFNNRYPWQADSGDDDAVAWREVDDSGWTDGGTPTACEVLSVLAEGDGSSCTGSLELKKSFVERVGKTPDGQGATGNYNPLFIYKASGSQNSTYLCFEPQSNAFQLEAQERCDDELPADLAAADTSVCEGSTPLICLP